MSKAEVTLVAILALLAVAASVARLARRNHWGRSSVSLVRLANAEPLKIDLNAAAWWELAWLPGIGESKARAIVEYRAAHGPFTDVYSLDRVFGISHSMVDRLKDFVVVNPPAPVAPPRAVETESR
jgi:competence ComEA-like helix-hairpin-helix protein